MIGPSGSTGQSGGSMGQSGGSTGQTGGSMGSGSSMGQFGGSTGQSGASMGQSGGSMGQSGCSIGQSGGSLGQSGGSMGKSGGSMGSGGPREPRVMVGPVGPVIRMGMLGPGVVRMGPIGMMGPMMSLGGPMGPCGGPTAGRLQDPPTTPYPGVEPLGGPTGAQPKPHTSEQDDTDDLNWRPILPVTGSPSRSRDKSPARSRDNSPVRSRDNSPARSRDKSPVRSRDKSPSRSRDNSPNRSQAKSPSKSRKEKEGRSLADMVEALRSRDLTSAGNAEDITEEGGPSPPGGAAANPPVADLPEEEAMESSELDELHAQDATIERDDDTRGEPEKNPKRKKTESGGGVGVPEDDGARPGCSHWRYAPPRAPPAAGHQDSHKDNDTAIVLDSPPSAVDQQQQNTSTAVVARSCSPHEQQPEQVSGGDSGQPKPATVATSQGTTSQSSPLNWEDKYNDIYGQYIRLQTKLQALVECPICFEVPRKAPIPCCRNGHIICSSCLDIGNITRCPACGLEMAANDRCVSNLGNSILDLIPHPCKYKVHGCQHEELLASIKSHQSNCKHREVRCPCHNCDEIIPMSNLSAHFESHGDSLDVYDVPRTFFKIYDQNKDNTSTPFRFSYDGNMFFLQVINPNADNLMYYFVQMEGAISECCKYRANIQLLGENNQTVGKQSLHVTNLDLHCLQDLQRIGSVMIITKMMLEDYISDEDSSYKIHVSMSKLEKQESMKLLVKMEKNQEENVAVTERNRGTKRDHQGKLQIKDFALRSTPPVSPPLAIRPQQQPPPVERTAATLADRMTDDLLTGYRQYFASSGTANRSSTTSGGRSSSSSSAAVGTAATGGVGGTEAQLQLYTTPYSHFRPQQPIFVSNVGPRGAEARGSGHRGAEPSGNGATGTNAGSSGVRNPWIRHHASGAGPIGSISVVTSSNNSTNSSSAPGGPYAGSVTNSSMTSSNVPVIGSTRQSTGRILFGVGEIMNRLNATGGGGVSSNTGSGASNNTNATAVVGNNGAAAIPQQGGTGDAGGGPVVRQGAGPGGQGATVAPVSGSSRPAVAVSSRTVEGSRSINLIKKEATSANGSPSGEKYNRKYESLIDLHVESTGRYRFSQRHRIDSALRRKLLLVMSTLLKVNTIQENEALMKHEEQEWYNRATDRYDYLNRAKMYPHPSSWYQRTSNLNKITEVIDRWIEKYRRDQDYRGGASRY